MKRILIMAICIALLFIAASCSGEMGGYGTLSATVSDASGAKTIQPSSDDLAFASFRIEGVYMENEKKISETFTSTSVSIDHLEMGTWRFTIYGYNKYGILLAQSSVHDVEIQSNGVSRETYVLEWLSEGEGSLSLELEVQSSRVASVECTLSKNGVEVGNHSMAQDRRTIGTDGMYIFSQVFDGIPAGSYVEKLSMKNGDGNPFGVTRYMVVRIHPNLTSEYSFSWKDFKDLLPNVEKPVISNIADGTASIRCDSTISLSVPEEGARILYSVDGGTSYSQYEGDRGIVLSGIEGLSERLELSFYAEKDGMNQSDVETKVYEVVHDPDRGNASYVWEKVSDGYECVASSKCLIHGSFVCETERASKTTKEVLKEPTCAEYGTDRYTSTFDVREYGEQTKEFSVAKKPHDYSNEVAESRYLRSEATCTAKAVYYRSCSVCGASSYSSSHTFEYGEALGHDYSSGTYADAECHWISCIMCGAKTGAKELHSFEDYRCTCGLWTKGPTGGYVFYDKGEYSDGWRYLEAAPADLRVVGGVPTVDATASGYDSANTGYIFGYYRTFTNGSNRLAGTDTAIGTGKSNTEKLVDTMGTSAYTSSRGSGTTSAYAARLCSMLEYKHDEAVYDDWFLPSRDELNLMYQNLKKNGIGSFADTNSWSSSENRSDSSANYAWGRNFDNGYQDVVDLTRYNEYRVRPVRAF